MDSEMHGLLRARAALYSELVRMGWRRRGSTNKVDWKQHPVGGLIHAFNVVDALLLGAGYTEKELQSIPRDFRIDAGF